MQGGQGGAGAALPGVKLTPQEIQAFSNHTKWLEVIIHFLSGFRNDTADFSRPQLRASVAPFFWVFVLLYGALVGLALALNAAALRALWGCGGSGGSGGASCSGTTARLVAHLAATHIVQCLLVLPPSLTVLLVQNWVFGATMCYVIPMLQDLTLHVVMLTHLSLALERYRWVRDPDAPRWSAGICVFLIWLLSVSVVMPYPMYTTYLDLGTMMRDQFHGVGICIVNLAVDMREYARAVFLLLYLLPLAVITFVHVRLSRELKRQSAQVSVMLCEAHARAHAIRFVEGPGWSCHGAAGAAGAAGAGEEVQPDELALEKEKQAQKHMVWMLSSFTAATCPLMLLRLTKLDVHETYENAGHFDITFMILVWIAFFPCCITPLLVASWTRTLPAWRERLLCRAPLKPPPQPPAAAAQPPLAAFQPPPPLPAAIRRSSGLVCTCPHEPDVVPF